MADRQTKDFEILRRELIRDRSLFVDYAFPAELTSVYPSGRLPERIERLVWKRPGEITRKPQFFVEGTHRSDLNQGSIGDCWFIAAAAVLATGHPKQFRRVVPDGQDFDQDYAGIFHFNFWCYGRWIEIVIDDYLPTDGYKLLYCSNREFKDEFWSALLEKAYAKLHGSYEALIGGMLSSALVDFTGGISEWIELDNKNAIPKDLYDLLYKSYSMNSLMGGGIWKKRSESRWEERMENGLFGGHAYSITGFTTIKTSYGGKVHRLIRLRNPWGDSEWNGAWSDSSPEMSSLSAEIKRDLQFRKRDDGEFWMAYEDFVLNFDVLNFCHLQPDAYTEEIAQDEAKQHWNVTVYHDRWIRGVTAGGCGNAPYSSEFWQNPQFFVTLKDVDDTLADNQCTLIVSLMEKEKGDANRLAIEFRVFQLKKGALKPLNGERAAADSMELASHGGSYTPVREVTRRMELPPAVYVIIPSTFRPFEEGEFLLRIYTEKGIDSGVLAEEEDIPVFPATPKGDILAVLFFKHAGKDKRLDIRELKVFLFAMSIKDLKEKIKFKTESCRSLLMLIDKSDTGMLDLYQTRELWNNVQVYREVFIKFDKDNSGSVDTFELTSMFSALGFSVNRAVLTSIVRRYGGRNRRITLQDFITFVCKLILMNSVFVKKKKSSRGEEDVAAFTRNEFLQYTMYC